MAPKRKADFDVQLLMHIQYGRASKAKSMLNKELAKKHNGSYTLLHYAALWNSEEIVHNLLELGAEIESLDINENTPLMLATEHGNRQVVRALLDANANVEHVNKHGVSALRLACESEYQDSVIIEIIFNRLQQTNNNIEELIEKLIVARCTLPQAMYLRNNQVIQGMLKRGVDVNSRDHWNGTALQIAIRMKDVELVKLLLEYRANVNILDQFGLSPLLTASCVRSKEIMKILLEAGASPNVKTNFHSYTPLHFIFNYMEYATTEETDECIALLFQHGAIPENPRPLLKVASKRDDSMKKIFMLVNYLAMLKELGRPISNSDLHVEREPLHSDILILFDSCEKFLKIKVFNKLSILDLLTASDKNMITHACNYSLMSTVQQILSDDTNQILFPFYCSTLSKRISKAGGAVKIEEAAIKNKLEHE